MKKFLLLSLLIFFFINTYAQLDGLVEGIDYRIVDKAPIANGCNPDWSNEELKVCFTNQITKQLLSKIDISFLENQNLGKGTYSVNVFFTINKKGKVKGVRTEFQNEKIAKYIKNVVKLIDKVKPAYLDNKPVDVKYLIPIRFNIE